MNKFPIYPKYEAGDYCGYEFDPQTDYTDFLSEARKHTDKKKNQGIRETSKGSTINKPKRGCVSGPMPGISGPGTIAGKPNKPLSGHLTSLFSSMNRVDNEIPYLCLKKVKDSTADVQSYGPVYLAT
ncbi:hypothetical protein P3S68_013770 [Capsicum galapagoense]